MIGKGDWVMIIDLHRQGLTVTEISRRTGLDRKTIRRWIGRGMDPPAPAPHKDRGVQLDPYKAWLTARTAQFPELNGTRLLREIREMGYAGGYTQLTDFLRTVRPKAESAPAIRFETPPGKQAQVDFAEFRAAFPDSPPGGTKVQLFSMVLGCSRMLWGRFVPRQDMDTVIRCHEEAFLAFGGVPGQIVYDRMKTVVAKDEPQAGGVAYSARILSLSRHYGFAPWACRAYRAQTKGKVERPFRYIREDFFLGRTFSGMEDLNAQFDAWLGGVANARVHATTGRVVAGHFAEERPFLLPLPHGPLPDAQRMWRKVSKDGFVSVGGLFYPVALPPGRKVDVEISGDRLAVLDGAGTVAAFAVSEGRPAPAPDPKAAAWPKPAKEPASSGKIIPMPARPEPPDPPPAAQVAEVAPRSLAVYDLVALRLSKGGRP